MHGKHGRVSGDGVESASGKPQVAFKLESTGNLVYLPPELLEECKDFLPARPLRTLQRISNSTAIAMLQEAGTFYSNSAFTPLRASDEEGQMDHFKPVSYTHLTLPTKRIV